MPSSAASSPLGFYKTRFEVENNLTRSVLKAIPADQLDYRPHERSPSTGQIAWTIIRGLFICIDMASQGISDVVLATHPSFRELLDRFEDASRRHAAQLESWSEAAWARTAQLRSGGRVALERPTSEIVWLFLFDEIHHSRPAFHVFAPNGLQGPIDLWSVGRLNALTFMSRGGCGGRSRLKTHVRKAYIKRFTERERE